ncbi:MAG: type III secretion system export apparatus subunit SctR [Bosea sp. (in: a-proteobacteria)]
MNNFGNSLSSILALSAFLGLVPFLAVAVTSYTKIAVVLLVVRNAIGIQQTPPNIIIYTIAILLSFYVMYPVMTDIYTIVSRQNVAELNMVDLQRVIAMASEPVRAFLLKFVDESEQQFYIDTLKQIWPNRTAVAQKNDFVILVPAFLAEELTRAFQLGFLLYIPFLVVDIVVSAILIALGLQMMSPTIISIPFKLLLFVAIDGWNRLFQGLILSYVPQ